MVPGSGAGATALTVTALGTGAAGNGIFVEIDSFDIGADPFGAAADPKRFNLTVVDSVTGTVERFTNLTTASGNARTADAVVNDPATGSRLVKIAMAPRDAAGPAPTGTVYKIGAGPTAATIAADLKLALTITRRQADGTADAANTVTASRGRRAAERLAHPGEPARARRPPRRGDQPDAPRATPAEVAKLAGAEVQGELFEGGAQFRLSLTRPTGPAGTARIHDATVTFAGPASGSSLSAAYNMGTVATPHVSSGPSRIRLGLPDRRPGHRQSPPASTAPRTASRPTRCSRTPSPLSTGPTRSSTCSASRTWSGRRRPTQRCRSTPTWWRCTPRRRGCAARSSPSSSSTRHPHVDDVGSAEAVEDHASSASPSTHAGAWFPRIRVDDPLQPGSIISHPPSGAIAGVIARTDAQVGRLAGAGRHRGGAGRGLRTRGVDLRRRSTACSTRSG